jgi:hypothetical protein
MPNGGFGCAYCQFYTSGNCNLRGAKISSDHWTVCANVTHMESGRGPTRVIDYLGYKPLDTNGVEVKGSIFAITSDEGAYIQVPWLENQEVFVIDSEFPCSICEKARVPSKWINWKGDKFYFCSYEHYLSWRDERILSGDALDAESGSDLLSYVAHFNSLKVIKENTTPEQRAKALKRDFWRRTFRGLRRIAVFTIVVSFFVWVLNYFLR